MSSQQFTLDEVLGWSSTRPSPSSLILCEDGMYGDVILVSFLRHSLTTGASVCLVGVEHTYEHYNQMARKMVRFDDACVMLYGFC